jgi:hypothetical protein
MGSVELGTNSIKMITKDWRLIERILRDKYKEISDFDLESIGEDEAADMCEEMDQINNILIQLSAELGEQQVRQQQAIAS